MHKRDERHERETAAKGGSVPPDLRRHSKARSESAQESGATKDVDQDTQRRAQGTQRPQ